MRPGTPAETRRTSSSSRWPFAAATRSDGAWVVPGTFRRDELARLAGLVLPAEDDAETLSGVVTARLGRLVRRGDEITHDGWVVRVLTVEGRRAGQIEVVAPTED